MSSRRIPLRTCAGCGRKAPKHELIRLVRVESGLVEIDVHGKQPGRGCYLCPSLICWETGIGKGRIGHALGASIPAESRAYLIDQASHWIEFTTP